MSLSDITNELASIREELSRHYQFNGVTEDQSVLAEAIACVAAAEERVHRAFPLQVA